MGCNTSVLAKAPLPAELQAANRNYFNLAELPITLTATPHRQGLEVKVAGLEQDNLLLALEAGFHSRRYWVADATVHINHGFFIARFNLKPQEEDDSRQGSDDAVRAMTSACKKVDVVPLSAGDEWRADASPIKEYLDGFLGKLSLDSPIKDYLVAPCAAATEKEQLPAMTRMSSNIIADDQYDLRANTARHLAKADKHAVGQGAVVRLTIVREWAPGLRVALAKTIRDSGLRIIMARLSMARRTTRRTVKDTFWLALAGHGVAEQLHVSMQGDMPSWLRSVGASLEVASPRKQYEAFVVSAATSRSEQQEQQGAPAALQRKVAALEYRVEASSWGVQFDGLQKFCGSGMTVAHSGAHVLAFATFYVLEKDMKWRKEPTRSFSTSSFGALMSAARGCAVAEFITEYEPQERCLTIFKVFLNGVLPSRKRAGVRVAAEQLAHMPVQGNEQWGGLEVVRGLRKIHLCDVVNWNTYSLMSKVGKGPDNDMEKWLLQEEAQAVGLTLADIKSKTVTEIFARTVLGKVVHRILETWREEQIAEHAVESVSVKFGDTQELIHGEYRCTMDIYIGLACTSALPPTPFWAQSSNIIGG